MSKDTGGAAFPVPHSIDGNWVREPIEQFSGMTLRDYFAAKAMQGLIGDGALREAANRVYSLSALSYQQADAMLEARKK